MAYDLYRGDREDQAAKVVYLMHLHQQARLQRVNFENQWEESAGVCWPEYRNSFTFGHTRAPGVKYTQFQVDSTGAIAAHRFMAIADMMMTPFNMMWSKIEADNPDLMRNRAAREYFDDWTRLLWRERYRPDANFVESQQTNWHCLGVFGNQGMLIDKLDSAPGYGRPGLRYMPTTPGELYILVNHQGKVDGYIRNLKWLARQICQEWPDTAPGEIRAALEKGDMLTRFDVLEFVLPNTEYNPDRPFSRTRGKPWSSCYISLVGRKILEEGGYTSFPLAHGRYAVAPEEWYGRGPAQQVLPDLKSLNAAKEAFLRATVEGGDPIRLLPDDTSFDFKATAGNWVFGGVNEEGKPMVQNLPPGDVKYTEAAMTEFKQVVSAAFLNDLYPEIFDKDGRPRNAREVVESINSRNLFMGPLAKQMTYLGACINREMVLIREMGMAPPMPPVVREARGDFKTVYTSPMGRAIDGLPIAGFMRTAEMLGQLAQLTGNNSLLDPLDFDAFGPDAAESQFVPVRWTSTPQQIAAIRRQRAQQAQQENYVRSLPGLAARDKAQAIVAKAQTGGNIGGTLSGMAPGGMPVMPASPRGQPGRPGMSGVPAR